MSRSYEYDVLSRSQTAPTTNEIFSFVYRLGRSSELWSLPQRNEAVIPVGAASGRDRVSSVSIILITGCSYLRIAWV